MYADYFSNDYAEARARFLAAADRGGWDIQSHPVLAESHDDLTIDVAITGAADAPTVVVSSGVHGVEGFLGSALQLALMDQLSVDRPDGLRYVIIHAVNPYGFARLRRFDETGVDLNRNYHTSGEEYAGAPAAYVEFNEFLNPTSPPSKFEPFALKALWLILRHGLHSLKEAVAGGQYEFPQGLFFGGKAEAASTEIVQLQSRQWLGTTGDVIHFDIHSGLGRFGDYKLLVGGASSDAELSWYADTFGEEFVEVLTKPGGTAYTVSGMFGDWMRAEFADRNLRSLGVEFGTYNVIRVLASIRAENRAHHYGDPNSDSYRRAKAELLECFCPESPLWRNQTIEQGLKIIRQGINSLAESFPSRVPELVS